jgi:hypothetical protein
MSRIHRVALAVVAVIRRHGRSTHVCSRVSLLATVHVLLGHRRQWCLRIGIAQSRRGRSISWTLESGGIYVRRTDLWHWRRRPIVSPWFMALTLQTGSRLVTGQLTGRDGDQDPSDVQGGSWQMPACQKRKLA